MIGLRFGPALRILILLAGIVLMPFSGTGLAADNKKPPALGEALPPDLALVPADAIGFVHVRVAQMWNSELGASIRKQQPKEMAVFQQGFEKQLGVTPAEVERLTMILPSPQGMMPLFIAVTTGPVDREKVLEKIMPGAEKAETNGKVLYTSKKPGRASLCFISDQVILTGPELAVVQLLAQPPQQKAKGALKLSLELAAQKHLVTEGFQVPPAVAAAMKTNFSREFPRDPVIEGIVGGLKPLLETRSGAHTMDIDDHLDAKLWLTFDNEDQAREALWPARDGLALGRLWLQGVIAELERKPDVANMVQIFRDVQLGLRSAAIEREGATIQVHVQVKMDREALATLNKAASEVLVRLSKDADRMTSLHSLKQIGLAMHNYYGDYQTFPPPAITGKDGKPLLSWRVAILPFLDEEKLYKKFKLDEPWDSEHNKALLKEIPKAYAPVRIQTDEPGMTFYRGFMGNGAFFNETGPTRIPDITDGTSNTLMVVEAGEPVPWTKPDELPYDPKKPLPKLGAFFDDSFTVLVCDGSVRSLRKDIKEETLRALITRDGGEPVGIPDVDR